MSDTPRTDGYSELRLTVARTARWGVLGALAAETTDVWIVLHGYAQLAAAFAAATVWPAARNRAYVFPEALQRFYDDDSTRPQRRAESPVGASWMTREARDDDIADNHAYLDALLCTVRERAPRATYTVFGFSQGGSTAARWGELRAGAGDPARRLILWGSALPPETDLGTGAPLRNVPVTIVYGTRDRWISAERIKEESDRLAAANFPVKVYMFEGGHRLDNATLENVARAD